MDTDWSIIWTYLPDLLRGAWMTVQMAVVGLAIAAIFGLILALASASHTRFARWPAIAFVEFFRTTPFLVQIIWFYFVPPVLFGWDISSFTAAALALGLNAAAFQAENYRAGLQSVDRSQLNAAKVLGMTRWTTYRYVIIPQAIRKIIPPSTTLVVIVIKSTALASAIGVMDLMRVSQLVSVETFRSIEILTMAAIIYFLMAYPLTMLSRYLERRLAIAT